MQEYEIDKAGTRLFLDLYSDDRVSTAMCVETWVDGFSVLAINDCGDVVAASHHGFKEFKEPSVYAKQSAAKKGGHPWAKTLPQGEVVDIRHPMETLVRVSVNGHKITFLTDSIDVSVLVQDPNGCGMHREEIERESMNPFNEDWNEWDGSHRRRVQAAENAFHSHVIAKGGSAVSKWTDRCFDVDGYGMVREASIDGETMLFEIRFKPFSAEIDSVGVKPGRLAPPFQISEALVHDLLHDYVGRPAKKGSALFEFVWSRLLEDKRTMGDIDHYRNIGPNEEISMEYLRRHIALGILAAVNSYDYRRKFPAKPRNGIVPVDRCF